jgi:hypothetical protein
MYPRPRLLLADTVAGSVQADAPRYVYEVRVKGPAKPYRLQCWWSQYTEVFLNIFSQTYPYCISCPRSTLFQDTGCFSTNCPSIFLTFTKSAALKRPGRCHCMACKLHLNGGQPRAKSTKVAANRVHIPPGLAASLMQIVAANRVQIPPGLATSCKLRQ